MIYQPILAWKENEYGDHYFLDKHCRKDWWVLLDGGPISGWPTDLAVKARCGDPRRAKLGDILEGALTYVSRKLRTALEDAGVGGVQWLPVRVTGAQANAPEFYYMHVVGCVEALDTGGSDVSFFPKGSPAHQRGKICSVRKYSLFEDELPSADVFRIKEYNVTYFVSEKVKSACLAAGFTFWDFVPVGLSKRTIQ